jgi:hypothetical protein
MRRIALPIWDAVAASGYPGCEGPMMRSLEVLYVNAADHFR